MAEYKFPAQVNYGWGLSLNMTGKAPAVAKRIFETYEDALAYVNDANDSAIAGLTLTVMNDTEDKNGVYFVAKVGSSVGANDGVLEQVGSQSQIDGSIEKEATARKKVTGINADTYQPNGSANYIQKATSMNDADVKLDTALKTVSDSVEKNKVVSGNGIDVVVDANTTVSIKIDGATDSYLTVSESGLKLSGVKSEIDTINAYTINSKVITSNPVLVGSDIELTGYVQATGTSSELFIAPEDSVNKAFGKLEKAIIDNEETTSKAVDSIKTAIGLDESLKYVAPEGTNYLTGATSVKDADSKLDAEIKKVSDSLAAEVGKDCLVSVEAGNGITVTQKASRKQTISANVLASDPILGVGPTGIKSKDNAIWDCGTY